MDKTEKDVQDLSRRRHKIFAQAMNAQSETDFRTLFRDAQNEPAVDEWALRSAVAANQHAPQWFHEELMSGGWFDHMLLTSTDSHTSNELLQKLGILTFNEVKQRRGYRNQGDVEIIRARARYALLLRGISLPEPKGEENGNGEGSGL